MPLPTDAIEKSENRHTLLADKFLISNADPTFHRFARLAAQWTHAATALISLVSAERRLVIGYSGLAESLTASWGTDHELPLTYTFCHQVLESGSAVIIENTSVDLPLAEAHNLSALSVGAYAGLPLRAAQGKIAAVFCIIDSAPHAWTPEELDTLGELAASAETHLNLLAKLNDQDEALQALAHTEEAYRLLIDNSADCMLVTELNGAILSANPAATQIFGYSEAELQNMGRMGLVDPTDSRLRAAIEERQRTGLFRGELRMVCADGTILDTELTSRAYSTADGTKYTSMIIRDVSDKKRIERQLRESQERFAKAFSASPMAMAMSRLRDGAFIEINDRFSQIIGYSRAEILNDGETILSTFIDLSDRLYIRNALQSTGTLRDYELKIRTKDGITRYGLVSYEIIEIGGEKCVLTALSDITARREMESRLAESEARYRSVISAMAEGITLQSADSTILASNASAERILGLSQDQLTGRTSTDPRWRAIHEDGTPFPGIEHPSIVSLETGQPLSNVIMGVYKPDGVLTWISINVQPLINPGEKKPYAVVTSFSDITQRVQLEKALNRHIDQLKIMHKINSELTESLNLQLTLELSLHAAIDLSAAEAGYIALVDQDRLQLAHVHGAYPWPQNVTETDIPRGILDRVLASGQAEFVPDVSTDPDYKVTIPNVCAQMVYPLIMQDRVIGIIVLETSQAERFTPEVFNLILLLVGHMAAAIDNARLYNLSQQQLVELQKLYDKVHSLEQIKTDMIRIASHDLRNPLSNIIGFMTVLDLEMGSGLSVDHRYVFEQITENAKRMSEITTDILSLERIEAVGDQFTHPVNLNQLVEKAFHQVKAQAQAKCQICGLDVTSKPIMVNGDEAQIYEAVINLIINAIKYTPENGHIDVVLKAADNQAIVTIKDTGFGIPVEMQPQLFQPFFRANTRETTGIAGTGLGLYLVKNIIERHKGKIVFQSVYGQGSLFGFQLPLATR